MSTSTRPGRTASILTLGIPIVLCAIGFWKFSVPELRKAPPTMALVTAPPALPPLDLPAIDTVVKEVMTAADERQWSVYQEDDARTQGKIAEILASKEPDADAAKGLVGRFHNPHYKLFWGLVVMNLVHREYPESVRLVWEAACKGSPSQWTGTGPRLQYKAKEVLSQNFGLNVPGCTAPPP